MCSAPVPARPLSPKALAWPRNTAATEPGAHLGLASTLDWTETERNKIFELSLDSCFRCLSGPDSPTARTPTHKSRLLPTRQFSFPLRLISPVLYSIGTKMGRNSFGISKVYTSISEPAKSFKKENDEARQPDRSGPQKLVTTLTLCAWGETIWNPDNPRGHTGLRTRAHTVPQQGRTRAGFVSQPCGPVPPHFTPCHAERHKGRTHAPPHPRDPTSHARPEATDILPSRLVTGS